MTDEASLDGTASLPAGDPAALARHRHVLRLALGTTLSLVTAEMLDWELSFLISVGLAAVLFGWTVHLFKVGYRLKS